MDKKDHIFDLQGKTALVTGATHGLGMAMAKALGRAGARILFNGHSSQEKIDNATKEYLNSGIDAIGYLFNVNRENEVAEYIERIEQEVAPIDILINNAGIIKRIPILEMSLSDWEAVIQTDLTSCFIVSKSIVPGMIKRGHGKIINVCSMMSELGRDTVAAYAAAKGGLKMLTRNMATEWGRHNIQINGIGPGYFKTSQTAPLLTPDNPFNNFIISRTPAERWGELEELGGPAVFLASKASDFVNGHILYVDGGLLASIGKPLDG